MQWSYSFACNYSNKKRACLGLIFKYVSILFFSKKFPFAIYEASLFPLFIGRLKKMFSLIRPKTFGCNPEYIVDCEVRMIDDEIFISLKVPI